MWDRIRSVTFLARKQTTGPQAQPSARSRRRPLVEVLENRELMTASLAPITNFTVPAQLGYQLPLNPSSGSTAAKQTFTATSSNPNIKVSVAQGQFWTLTVSHHSSGTGDPQINNETMTFQLFQDLTPTTVSRITNLTNQNYLHDGFPAQFLAPGPPASSSRGSRRWRRRASAPSREGRAAPRAPRPPAG